MSFRKEVKCLRHEDTLGLEDWTMRITEEQGKCLQMMFEQQRKMEQDKLKPSSSHSDEPAQLSSLESPERKHSEECEPVASELSPPPKRAKTGEACDSI
ncbi:hypothetical protein OROMI_023630 [Orobanche minor]